MAMFALGVPGFSSFKTICLNNLNRKHPSKWAKLGFIDSEQLPWRRAIVMIKAIVSCFPLTFLFIGKSHSIGMMALVFSRLTRLWQSSQLSQQKSPRYEPLRWQSATFGLYMFLTHTIGGSKSKWQLNSGCVPNFGAWIGEIINNSEYSSF